MNIKDLEYFNELCNSKSFTKASQNLFITQPTITNSIKRLESELNTKIFIRSNFNKNIELTESGEILKEYTKKILKELKELKDSIEKLESKEIILGTPPLINTYFLPKITQKLLENKIFKYINFVEEGSSDLIDIIINNKLDLGIIAYLEWEKRLEQLDLKVIKKDKFRFCVGKSHELSKNKNITLEDLDNRNFLVLKETYLDNVLLHKLLKDNNIKAKKIINVDSVEVLKLLISSGSGVGIMFDLAIDDMSDLVELDLPKENYLTISLAFNKNNILKKNEKLLYDIILSEEN